MSEPFFSVCIPTYNRAGMIAGALESVLAQAGPSFEAVVCDNASTDATAHVLAGFRDDRVRVIRNVETVTMYANHNVCVRNAAAPWVVFLHSDDRLEPAALEALRRRIEAQPCDVVYPAKAVHRGDLGAGDRVLSGAHAVPSLLRWPAGTPSGAAYRRELLERQPFHERGFVSDFLLLADILLAGGRIVICAAPIVEIGEGAFQHSSRWHRSGRFITDVSTAYKAIIGAPGVLDDLVREVATWSDAEIAFLLLMLSHADERAAIGRVEHALGVRTTYRRLPGYRHVRLYKLLGWSGLRAVFAAVKMARNAGVRDGVAR